VGRGLVARPGGVTNPSSSSGPCWPPRKWGRAASGGGARSRLHGNARWIELSCMFPTVWVASRYPVIVKPRHAGAAGASPSSLHRRAGGLRSGARPTRAGLSPGDEYSIDVLADHLGRVHACVPRVRVRGDSGHRWPATRCAIATSSDSAAWWSRSWAFLHLERHVRRDVDGRPSLLEVNPRVPATLALTAGAGVDMASMRLMHCEAGPFPQASSIVRSP